MTDPDRFAVHKYAHSAPIATGVCFNCGDPVVYNLAAGYCAHQDADGVTCREPWPGNPTNGDTDAR